MKTSASVNSPSVADIIVLLWLKIWSRTIDFFADVRNATSSVYQTRLGFFSTSLSYMASGQGP